MINTPSDTEKLPFSTGKSPSSLNATLLAQERQALPIDEKREAILVYRKFKVIKR